MAISPSPEQAQKFKSAWQQGVMLKRISEDLGVAEGTLKKWRIRMGLPKRLSGDVPSVRVIIAGSEYQKAGRRANELGMSMRSYVSMLIRQDEAENMRGRG